MSGKDSHFLDAFFTTQVNLNFPIDLRFETKYIWRAKCVNGNDSSAWSAPFNFTTTQQPWITSPSNKATNVPLSAILKWGVQGSNFDYIYQYQWSTDSSFIGTPIVSLPAQSLAEASVTNAYGTTYYWRGRAAHSKDTSSWTPIARYSSIAPPAISKIQLYSPSNNSINLPVPNVDLIWNANSVATTYEIEVSNYTDFSSVLSNAITQSIGITFRGMRDGTTYYWRVRGNLGSYNGPWSTVWKFSTAWKTGVSDADNETLDLAIFPNPCVNFLNISFPTTFNVEIFDAKGQSIFSLQNVTESTQINTQSFANGVYFVFIKTEVGVFRRKVSIVN